LEDGGSTFGGSAFFTTMCEAAHGENILTPFFNPQLVLCSSIKSNSDEHK
jgi:hypothetical protein